MTLIGDSNFNKFKIIRQKKDYQVSLNLYWFEPKYRAQRLLKNSYIDQAWVYKITEHNGIENYLSTILHMHGN